MPKNTSISLGKHFESIIESGIESGRYASASEVIRAGLRLVEIEESKIKALRNAISEGEQSGYVKNYDRKKHLAELKKKFSK